MNVVGGVDSLFLGQQMQLCQPLSARSTPHHHLSRFLQCHLLRNISLVLGQNPIILWLWGRFTVEQGLIAPDNLLEVSNCPIFDYSAELQMGLVLFFSKVLAGGAF